MNFGGLGHFSRHPRVSLSLLGTVRVCYPEKWVAIGAIEVPVCLLHFRHIAQVSSPSRSGGNSARIRKLRPDSGLGLGHFQVKVFILFNLFPARLAAKCQRPETVQSGRSPSSNCQQGHSRSSHLHHTPLNPKPCTPHSTPPKNQPQIQSPNPCTLDPTPLNHQPQIQIPKPCTLDPPPLNPQPQTRTPTL